MLSPRLFIPLIEDLKFPGIFPVNILVIISNYRTNSRFTGTECLIKTIRITEVPDCRV